MGRGSASFLHPATAAPADEETHGKRGRDTNQGAVRSEVHGGVNNIRDAGANLIQSLAALVAGMFGEILKLSPHLRRMSGSGASEVIDRIGRRLP